MKTIVAVAAALAVTGCATTNKDYLALLTAQQAVAVQNAEAAKARFTAMSQIAQTGDASSRTAAVMAMAMVQTPHVQLPAPPENEALKWASVFVPAITNLGANYFTYRLGAINSNNAAATTTAAYNAFSGMATAGYNAVQGTATAGFNSASTIAGFIQAPQANVTTTTTTTNTDNRQFTTTNNTSNTTNNTTSSTSNTTSNATTTNNTTSNTTNTTNSNNRTCQGGSGATGGAGGGTTTGGSGAPGGTGGSANC